MKLLDLNDARWMDFVGSEPRAVLFDHPAWARLLADCYGYRAMVAALTDGTGTIVGGLPLIDVSRRLGIRRWVSLPFTDYCPPLAGERREDFHEALRALAREHAVDVLELRAPLQDLPPSSDARYVRHELGLSADLASTWDRLFKNHRRNVRIAEKAGVRIVKGTDASDIETFYRLHLQTRRRLGVPIQPRRFFRLLLERLIQPGLGFILTAYSGEVPIASAIFGFWNGTLVYKYSARDERYAKLNANYLLLWTAIRWANENGCHTFDLGRSDADQPSLRQFKDGWGAREEPLPYTWLPGAPAAPSSRRVERAMSVAIRHSAPWVCRAIGEVFYRYAA
jgi:CelD/BcsL family acetyltransferase involved in cellulose biosynthesis